nr:HAMP domain-containing sensor histidine kinase [uncultured Oscillibacter sp.]
MRMLTNAAIKRLFLEISLCLASIVVLSQLAVRLLPDWAPLCLLVLSLLTAGGILASCIRYFLQQERTIEEAQAQISALLAGDSAARISCDEDGELFKLFHSVNTMAAVMAAHANKETQAKEFLKNTIADISHQLKTPLAALNIYNGLLQGEAADLPNIREFADLSEQELDRIETLVQNLLKITRLDAGTLVTQKALENVGDMMGEIEQHFSYRARQEQKTLQFSGPETTMLFCDREWFMEAVSNLVKNALDHTKSGDTVSISWRELPSQVRITVTDTGSGIHPEDIYHIFKRFYRSRFSKDTQGVGLGLPLAKAIIEAHDGMIQVDSALGRGSIFTVNLPIPTKL